MGISASVCSISSVYGFISASTDVSESGISQIAVSLAVKEELCKTKMEHARMPTGNKVGNFKKEKMSVDF